MIGIKIKEDIQKETVRKVQTVAENWFNENFDSEFLQQMEEKGLIKNAEGFKISMISELMVEMEMEVFGDIKF